MSFKKIFIMFFTLLLMQNEAFATEENNDLSLSESEMNKESGENDSSKNNKIKT